MKKIICFILASLIVLSFASCSASRTESPTEAEPSSIESPAVETAETVTDVEAETEAPESSAAQTTTLEPPTENETESEAETSPSESSLSSPKTLDEVAALLDLTFNASGSDLEYSAYSFGNVIVINSTLAGTDEVVENIKTTGSLFSEEWNTITSNVCGDIVYTSIRQFVDVLGFSDADIVLALVGDSNSDILYAASLNGDLVYDCIAAANDYGASTDLVSAAKTLGTLLNNGSEEMVEYSASCTADSIIIDCAVDNLSVLASQIKTNKKANSELWQNLLKLSCSDLIYKLATNTLQILKYDGDIRVVTRLVSEKDPAITYAMAIDGNLVIDFTESP